MKKINQINSKLDKLCDWKESISKIYIKKYRDMIDALVILVDNNLKSEYDKNYVLNALQKEIKRTKITN